MSPLDPWQGDGLEAWERNLLWQRVLLEERSWNPRSPAVGWNQGTRGRGSQPEKGETPHISSSGAPMPEDDCASDCPRPNPLLIQPWKWSDPGAERWRRNGRPTAETKRKPTTPTSYTAGFARRTLFTLKWSLELCWLYKSEYFNCWNEIACGTKRAWESYEICLMFLLGQPSGWRWQRKVRKNAFLNFFLHIVNSAHSIKYLHHGKKYPY